MMTFPIYYFITIFIISFLLTALLRIYALKKNVIDIPNERSSHTIPTPRGGGVSVVLSFLVAIGLCTYFDAISFYFGLTLFASSAFVAIIGFMDDHGHIDAKWRLLIHLTAAFAVVYCLDGLPILNLFGFDVDFGIFGYIFAVVAIIWILNLFNFMDGIDGIAGIEAVSATFFAGLFLSIISPDSSLALLHWLLAASVCGFLVLNFPPAKIFMGDSGSGFLGFMLAALALASGQVDQSMLWVWLTLLGVFIVDATFTVIHRLIRGEKIHEAHRSHAYQFASRKYNSHFKVTLAVLAINLLWLAPMAYLIVNETLNGSVALCIAYLPLVLLAIKFNAGAAEVKSSL
jgi:Fuc2NAc and GlcNAc transferase